MGVVMGVVTLNGRGQWVGLLISGGRGHGTGWHFEKVGAYACTRTIWYADPFLPHAGDVIHPRPVLRLVRGRFTRLFTGFSARKGWGQLSRNARLKCYLHWRMAS